MRAPGRHWTRQSGRRSADAGTGRQAAVRCGERSFCISNMVQRSSPKTARSLSSATIVLLVGRDPAGRALGCRSHTFDTTSVRGRGSAPTIAASSGEGCHGLHQARAGLAILRRGITGGGLGSRLRHDVSPRVVVKSHAPRGAGTPERTCPLSHMLACSHEAIPTDWHASMRAVLIDVGRPVRSWKRPEHRSSSGPTSSAMLLWRLRDPSAAEPPIWISPAWSALRGIGRPSFGRRRASSSPSRRSGRPSTVRVKPRGEGSTPSHPSREGDPNRLPKRDEIIGSVDHGWFLSAPRSTTCSIASAGKASSMRCRSVGAWLSQLYPDPTILP